MKYTMKPLNLFVTIVFPFSILTVFIILGSFTHAQHLWVHLWNYQKVKELTTIFSIQNLQSFDFNLSRIFDYFYKIYESSDKFNCFKCLNKISL